MNASELLGAVGAALLRERLANASDGDGLARFMLDRLTGQQVAAVVHALLLDGETAKKIKIAVPRDLVAAFDLPQAVITDERTVALRHAECDRPALLLANSDDDQGASLQDVTLLGAKQLTEEPRLWVEAAAAGLGLPESQLEIWQAALRGHAAAEDWTLHQVSNYVELTRRSIADESKPLLFGRDVHGSDDESCVILPVIARTFLIHVDSTTVLANLKASSRFFTNS